MAIESATLVKQFPPVKSGVEDPDMHLPDTRSKHCRHSRPHMSAAIPGHTRPLKVRLPDVSDRNRWKIARRVDAAENDRAPEAIVSSSALVRDSKRLKRIQFETA